ncbi:hypothetical protein GLOTRDRAFT_74825 [Gloeophyllum trabeum ATCC 11539]|uniref:Magnesium transporter n=1 Tax=Gloeophyllum trabeum (strain ATCC 11539 / FP-39264 / Madison 617) TaxID=670483 RepID=S7Q8F1_GLOTA|nr:uncharacterized protein GLOTRDRAFT_74825 [Gloeophyllum trabeum ATCC 11539]EPQ56261.1 hypothetical protein GLOTRDRAFT_74825 [Gloeophyllum trabeum ATCC 11539]
MFGRVLLVLGALALLHAAFSTYEHLSYLKALGRLEESVPNDVTLEALVGLFSGILGASLDAPALKEITWASEMKKRTIDEMDTRLGFANWGNRGSSLLGENYGKSK